MLNLVVMANEELSQFIHLGNGKRVKSARAIAFE